MKNIYLIILLFFAIASGALAQTTDIATLTEKAEAGDAKAQNDLGDAYSEGKGVNRNRAEALKWYAKAAKQGNADALYNLGNCCYNGTGITKDLDMAKALYIKAAAQGNEKAQNSLKEYFNLTAEQIQEETENNKIYSLDEVEVKPHFPGGEKFLLKYLSLNVRYPMRSMENKEQGRVVVKFVVRRDGTISDATVTNSVSELLDGEALRVVKAMPRWVAGQIKGKAVNVTYQLPVTFRFNIQ